MNIRKRAVKKSQAGMFLAGWLMLAGRMAVATVVFEENFDDGVADGWLAAGISGAFTVVDGAYQGNDSVSDNYAMGYVKQTAFLPFSTADEDSEIVTITFDYQVDNYSVALGSASTFRFLFQPTASTAVRYAVGLGFATVNSTDKVFLFAGGGSTPIPSASNAIGYNSGTGTWDGGFDLGSTVADGTGGVMFRFTLISDSTTGDLQIDVENLSTGDVTSYSDSMAPYVMDTTAGCSLWVVTGTSSSGTVILDNLSLAVDPKPETIGLLAYEEDFDDGVADGWTTSGSAGSYTVSGGALRGIDDAADGWSTSYVTRNSFLPFSTADDGSEIIKLACDLRVDNYSTALGYTDTFRFIFQPAGSDNRYVIGLGYAMLNAQEKVFLFAGAGSTPVPSASNAIGYNRADGTWDAGFDLGGDVSNGTGSQFFRFQILSNSRTGDMQIVVENLSTGDTTTFFDTWVPYVMDTSVGGSLWVLTGGASTGTVWVDNVSLRVDPAPNLTFMLLSQP